MGAMGPFDEGFKPELSQDYLELSGSCGSWSLSGCPGGTKGGVPGVSNRVWGYAGSKAFSGLGFLGGFLDRCRSGRPKVKKTRVVTLCIC